MKAIGQPIALEVKDVTGVIQSLNDLLGAYLRLKGNHQELIRREHKSEHELVDCVTSVIPTCQRVLITLIKQTHDAMENIDQYHRYITTNGMEMFDQNTQESLCDDDITRLVSVHLASVNWEPTPDGECSTREQLVQPEGLRFVLPELRGGGR
jgi:hypothetical protein